MYKKIIEKLEMIKIKYLNIFWLIIPILFLQPSFACGCGGENSLSLGYQILTWMIRLIVLFIYLIPSLWFVKFYQFLSLKIVHFIVPHMILFLMIGVLFNTDTLGLMKIYDQIRDVIPPFFVIVVVGIFALFLWFYPILYILKMNGKRTTSKV
ncbi:hypothetical protein ACFODO_01615 [Acinetobacter sichuanensis]|uniref:DUF2752 domain-containing protein n=2 Tax=Acinetobacter sichuanensis TaxID=2136183 RepID=A0ABV7BAJ3_9GAMM|nr:hypothetical protein [Acinetobacter sichuanensis]